MEEDFYIDKSWLASYCEKDWFDHIRAQKIECSHLFEFPAFSSQWIYCPYHEMFADFIGASIQKVSPVPERMIELGSALGRTFYELCGRIDSLKEAILVEPSSNLASTFSKIFNGGDSCEFPVLKGNKDMTAIRFRTREIQNACSKVKRTLLNIPYEDVPDEIHPAELVVCSNVIDQCQRPAALVELLKRKTASEGILALSCTYQWNKKYIPDNEPLITNVNDFFQRDWHLLGESDIEFKCRRTERQWVTFLSRVSVLQKSR